MNPIALTAYRDINDWTETILSGFRFNGFQLTTLESLVQSSESIIFKPIPPRRSGLSTLLLTLASYYALEKNRNIVIVVKQFNMIKHLNFDVQQLLAGRFKSASIDLITFHNGHFIKFCSKDSLELTLHSTTYWAILSDNCDIRYVPSITTVPHILAYY